MFSHVDNFWVLRRYLAEILHSYQIIQGENHCVVFNMDALDLDLQG